VETSQTKGAKELLGVILSATKNGETLTYCSAAERMGRVPPHDHARAVSKMCDLLDAAACFAGRPSLALVKVLETSGTINQRAWEKEFGPRRDAIIQRSLKHTFDDSDFAAIASALDALGGKGADAAWKYIGDLYPDELLYRRLIADYTAGRSDSSIDTGSAIDDLGTDSPNRSKLASWSYARDPKVREAVLSRAQGVCEFCDRPGFTKVDGSRYLETHHIIALADEGADRVTNVIAVCANDHREAHFGRGAKEIEKLMIAKVEVRAKSRTS